MAAVHPRIATLIRSLKRSPDRDGVFNPWRDVDIEHEISDKGPAIRRRQYGIYLTERLNRAKYLLVGEAPGYQGGHFTGIPMTSERLLLGGLEARGVYPTHAFRSIEPQRTSKPEIRECGFSEPTCTIVWSRLIELGIDPYEVIIWNAYPWHSYNPSRGMLSNRTPGDREMLLGQPLLGRLLEITGVRHIVAVGRKSHDLLGEMGYRVERIRHPASGGAPAFKKQFAAWMESIR